MSKASVNRDWTAASWTAWAVAALPEAAEEARSASSPMIQNVHRR
ncbi:hypothetical protein N4G66_22660 [Streptomyces rhizosphaerihabitans]|nr:hypothetical protein [Streptomyces rhizosphaerihabitans]MCT9007631.1 hypothetical protein [Streptomyces rhizosphaerihabitans]